MSSSSSFCFFVFWIRKCIIIFSLWCYRFNLQKLNKIFRDRYKKRSSDLQLAPCSWDKVVGGDLFTIFLNEKKQQLIIVNLWLIEFNCYSSFILFWDKLIFKKINKNFENVARLNRISKQVTYESILIHPTP